MKTVAALCLVLTIIACGDSTGPGARATSVTAAAGDSQIAPTGAAFQFPFGLVTLGADGQPLENVHVTWSVTPAGAARFSPPTSVSDANGQASTIVIAGITAQEITIQASVSGVSAPVVFHALVADPCAYARGLIVGETVNGILATSDCRVTNGPYTWYYDYYAFALASGQHNLRIAMRSSTFDTYLDLFNATSGQYIAFDDDSILQQEQNSQLDIILPGDTYVIGANSFDTSATGSYSIAIEDRASAMNGCREVWVVNGVSVSDAIAASDCADGTVPSHFDVARIMLDSLTTVTIAERSTAMNPSLALYQIVSGSIVNGHYPRALVASNDDSTTGNPNAFVTYSVPLNGGGPYDIIIGTSGASETGPYTLDVSTAATPSSPASAKIVGSRDWWRSPDASLKRSKH